MAQTVKNLPIMQETRAGSLGGEDPLEREMAAHSPILAWRIPWMEKPGFSMGLHRVHGVATSQKQLSNDVSLTHSLSYFNLYEFMFLAFFIK